MNGATRRRGLIGGSILLVTAAAAIGLGSLAGGSNREADGTASTTTTTVVVGTTLPEPEKGRPCQEVARDFRANNRALETNRAIDDRDNDVEVELAELETMQEHLREEQKTCVVADEDDESAPTSSTEATTESTVAPATTAALTCEQTGTWAVTLSDRSLAEGNSAWLPLMADMDTALPGGQDNLAQARELDLAAAKAHYDYLANTVHVWAPALGMERKEIPYDQLVDARGCLTQYGRDLYMKVEAIARSTKWVWMDECTIAQDGTGVTADGRLVRRDGLGTVAGYGCWAIYRVGDPTVDPQVQPELELIGTTSARCGNKNLPPGTNVPPGDTPNPPEKPRPPVPPTRPPPGPPVEPPPTGKDHTESPVSSDRDDPDEGARPYIPAPAEVIRPEPAAGSTTTTQAPPPATIADPPEVQDPESAANTSVPTPYTPVDPIDECGDADGDGIPDCG